MKFEPAKCPCCGADIQVPSGMEMAKCMFCGSTLVVKDAIQKLKISVSGEVTFNANIDSMVNSGNGFISLDKWSEAEKLFNNVIELDSLDYRGWWGLFLAKSKNMSIFNGYMNPIDITDAYTAIKLASTQVRSQLQSDLENYLHNAPVVYQINISRDKQLAGSEIQYYFLSIDDYDPLQLELGQTVTVQVPASSHKFSCWHLHNKNKPSTYSVNIDNNVSFRLRSNAMTGKVNIIR